MKKIVYLLFAVTILFAGCSKDDTYTLTGQVKNVSDRLVKSGTVSLMSGTTVSYTTPIAATGSYSFTDVKSGSYTLKVVASGYDNLEEAITISADGTKNAIVRGGATINGTIINSQTGQGLANTTLAFVAGNLKSGDQTSVDTSLVAADFVVVTDEYGNFSIDGMAIGIFVVVIRAEGYTTRVVANVTISVGVFQFPEITLVQQVAMGSFRIVLTWGLNPYDLDSHLTGPLEGGDRFHMYYVNQSPYGSDVNLDVDDTYSYGPETTTIEAFHDGMYRYSIFNYSEQGYEGGAEIFSSPTKVEVYDYTGLLRTYNAPVFAAGTGNTWRVFELNANGGNITITDVNTYLYANDDYMEKSGFGDKKPAMSFRPNQF